MTFALAQGDSHLVSFNNSTTNTQTPVTFDAAGNELQIGSTPYVYSARNFLASGDGISYAYDGLGRRVTAAMPAYGTRVSLYDPQTHLQSESQMHSGAISYDYIWFGDIPVAQEDIGAQTHWTVTDYLGTPFIQTNSSGTIYWQADYEPFGSIYALRTPDAHQPLRFPGQEAEELDPSQGSNGGSGRFYNGYRWYRPQWGRYTQSDPLEYQGSQYNVYGYANNNPVDETDVLGLCSTQPSSKVGCDSVLPNGKTIGDYVRRYRLLLENNVNFDSALAYYAANPTLSLETTTQLFYEIVRSNGPIDFKNQFGGNTEFSDAGNFAYYAIGSGILPTSELDAGAGFYAVRSALRGEKPWSSLTGPWFYDQSVQRVPPSLRSPLCVRRPPAHAAHAPTRPRKVALPQGMVSSIAFITVDAR